MAPRYPLKETPSEDYAQRTQWNVRDSDGTLVLVCGTELSGGTAQTIAYAQQIKKPHLVVDLAGTPSVVAVHEWIARGGIRVLNVAGPRESKCPGIYAAALSFLPEVFRRAS